MASVIGREFSYELIAGLELMSEEALAEGLRHLISSGPRPVVANFPTRVHLLARIGSGRRLRLAAEEQAASSCMATSPICCRNAGRQIAKRPLSCLPFTITPPSSMTSPHRCGCAPARPRLRASRLPRPSPNCVPVCRRCRNCGLPRAGTGWKSRCGPRSARRWWRNAAGAHDEVSQTLEPAWRLATLAQAKQCLRADPECAVGALHERRALTRSLRWADTLLKAGAGSTTTALRSSAIAPAPPPTIGSANSRRRARAAMKCSGCTIRSGTAVWRRSPTPILSPGKASIVRNSSG